MVKNLPARQETWDRALGQEQPPERMATHSSILAWSIPWTENPGGLQSMGSLEGGTWLSHYYTHTHTTKKSWTVFKITSSTKNKPLLLHLTLSSNWREQERIDDFWLAFSLHVCACVHSRLIVSNSLWPFSLTNSQFQTLPKIPPASPEVLSTEETSHFGPLRHISWAYAPTRLLWGWSLYYHTSLKTANSPHQKCFSAWPAPTC